MPITSAQMYSRVKKKIAERVARAREKEAKKRAETGILDFVE